MREEIDRLDVRIRACERSIEELRAQTGREATELRQSLIAVSKDIEDLTRTLREWRGDMDQIFRERWPALEGRLVRIETTVEQVARVKSPSVVDSNRHDWRVLGIIAAVLFGGGLTVGGSGGAGISALLQNSHTDAPSR